MATGFTHDVVNGNITSFKEFALKCSRAFGALITLRDDPLTSDIPDKIEPSTDYYDRGIKNSIARLKDLRQMSFDDAEYEAEKDYQDSLEEWQASKKRASLERTRLNAMLSKVNAWNPPTSDHTNMKDFYD